MLPTSLCPEGAVTCQPRASVRESCERARRPGLPNQTFSTALKGRNRRHGPMRRFPAAPRNGARSTTRRDAVRHSFWSWLVLVCESVSGWSAICCALSGLCADSAIRNPGLRNRGRAWRKPISYGTISRSARGCFPWADMFCPFGAGDRQQLLSARPRASATLPNARCTIPQYSSPG